MIDIGELREKIDICIVERVENDMGFDVETEVIKSSPRAKVKTVSSKEFYSNNSPNAEITNRFIIRYKKDLTMDHYIKYKNEKYDIKHIAETGGYKQFHEVTATYRKKK